MPTDDELTALRERGARTRLSDAEPAERIDAILYNHLADRHEDFIPAGKNRFPEEFFDSASFAADVEALKRSYDERIRQIDRALGELRRTLEELGQWEDTLLVVLADHGESFFEHGLPRHDYVPFDEAMRVPLVVSWPRVLGGRARVVDDLVWHLDLYPTLMRLAGLDGARERVDRRDLTGLLLGTDQLEADRAVFPSALRPAHLEQEPLRRVVVTPEWKFIEGHEWYGDSEGLLFGTSDRAELQNLREERPEVAAELKQRIELHTGRLSVSTALRNGSDVEPSAADLDELRELGYLDDG